MYIDIELLKSILMCVGLVLTVLNWMFNIIVLIKLKAVKSGKDITIGEAAKKAVAWIKEEIPPLLPVVGNIVNYLKTTDDKAADNPTDEDNK